MPENNSELIIPDKDEIAKLSLPPEIELSKIAEMDFVATEEFPEDVGTGEPMGVLFMIHKFLVQMSRLWKQRWLRTHRRILTLERELELLKRKERRHGTRVKDSKKATQGVSKTIATRDRKLRQSKSRH